MHLSGVSASLSWRFVILPVPSFGVYEYMCPELESLECSSGHSDIDTLAGASFFRGISLCPCVRVCLIGTIRSQSQWRGKYSFKINTY